MWSNRRRFDGWTWFLRVVHSMSKQKEWFSISTCNYNDVLIGLKSILIACAVIQFVGNLELQFIEHICEKVNISLELVNNSCFSIYLLCFYSTFFHSEFDIFRIKIRQVGKKTSEMFELCIRIPMAMNWKMNSECTWNIRIRGTRAFACVKLDMIFLLCRWAAKKHAFLHEFTLAFWWK